MRYITVFFVLCVMVKFNSIDAGGMPGGLNDIPIDHVQKYTPLIEKSYNSQSPNPTYHQVLKVVSAKSQVVAGIRYIINYTLVETECKKEDVSKGLTASKDCKPTKTTHNCIADVIERAWENSISVVEMKCNDVVTQYYKKSD